VDSTVAVSPEAAESAAELRRAAAWRSTGVSPFGVGLRKLRGPDDYGVPVRRDSAPWMERGSAILLLRQPSEPAALDVFVVPPYLSVPAWIRQVETQSSPLLAHPNGARCLGRIEMHRPARHVPLAARTLSIPGFGVHEARDPLLVLELDDGRSDVVRDRRPPMPGTESSRAPHGGAVQRMTTTAGTPVRGHAWHSSFA
jgi:hypothetical protein